MARNVDWPCLSSPGEGHRHGVGGSGEGSPRLRMSTLDSTLIRPRESTVHLIEPSCAPRTSCSSSMSISSASEHDGTGAGPAAARACPRRSSPEFGEVAKSAVALTRGIGRYAGSDRTAAGCPPLAPRLAGSNPPGGQAWSECSSDVTPIVTRTGVYSTCWRSLTGATAQLLSLQDA